MGYRRRRGYVKHDRLMYDPVEGDVLWREPRTFHRWEAWADMIQFAAHGPVTCQSSGFTVVVPRGHFLASVRLLAGRWGWSNGKVVRFLRWCEDDGRLATANGTPIGTLYRLVNYDVYQSSETGIGTPNGTTTERGRNEKKSLKYLGAIEAAPEADDEEAPGSSHGELPEGSHTTPALVQVDGNGNRRSAPPKPNNRNWLAPFLDALKAKGFEPDRREIGKMQSMAKRLIDAHGYNVTVAAYEGWLLERKGKDALPFHIFVQNFPALSKRWAVAANARHEALGPDDPNGYDPMVPTWPEGWQRTTIEASKGGAAA